MSHSQNTTQIALARVIEPTSASPSGSAELADPPTRELNVLLVDANQERAYRVLHGVARRGLPQPVHVTSSEAALDWLRRRSCDLCLIIEPLPVTDDVPLLSLLRQYHPFLSILVIPDPTGSRVRPIEQPTVPRLAGADHDLPTAVGQLLEEWSHRPAIVTAQPGQSSDGLMAALTPPTYQNRLRLIGWQLDRQLVQSMSIWQVNSGFLVRVISRDQNEPAVLEFPDWQYLERVRRAIEDRGRSRPANELSSWLPSTYEDVLRALGFWLDSERVMTLTITEAPGRLRITALQPTATRAVQATLRSVEWELDRAKVAALLAEAVSRRR